MTSADFLRLTVFDYAGRTSAYPQDLPR